MASRLRIGLLFLGMVYLAIMFPMTSWASTKHRLISQRIFGTQPQAIKYSEYEVQGKTVIVILTDPQHLNFTVAFASPPKFVSQFHNDRQNALLTVNGGYWDSNHLPTDLCVVDGKVIKTANTGNSHFGLFAVRHNGETVIGDVKGKPLSKADEKDFRYALKSGPHLLRAGMPIPSRSISSHARTVVGKNSQNQVFFVITKTGTMTYAEMTDFLMDSGLGITDAFNLDGGTSTGFALGRGADRILMDSRMVADVIQVEMKVPR